ncbi:MAG TPA: branched-chain amino acid ABC transporter permease [Kouleothrix sp.]|jgi:branched-chain amino acid transport system permease protein|nr:branched-chain amino acid ABC transporter permease [Kouleothrix sp.]
MATTARSASRPATQNIGRWIVGGLLGLILALVLFRILSQAVQNPALLAQQLLTGVSKGAILAIIALGYTLVYGIIELINFAHGDVFMLGSFAALTLIGLSGLNRNTPPLERAFLLFVILIVVMCFTAFLNYSIERIAYRRLRNAPRLAPLISAIGVSFVLQNLGLLWGKLPWRRGDTGALYGLAVFVVLFAVGIWGITQLNKRIKTDRALVRLALWVLPLLVLTALSVTALNATRNAVLGPEGSPARLELEDRAKHPRIMGSTDVAPKDVPAGIISTENLFGDNAPIALSWLDIAVVLVSVSLMLGLYLFVQRTSAGKAMRATAQDRDAARLMGIDVDSTISLAFLLGGALAGAAGLIAAIYTTQVVFDLGFKAGLLSFTSAVLGGIGNVAGAMLGGFLIGLIQTLSDQYLATQWTNAVIFGILVAILVFRPTGLLGEDVGQKA